MSNLAEVRLIGAMYGSQWNNVIHFRRVNGSGVDGPSLVAVLNANFLPAYRNTVPRDVLFQRWEIRDANNNNLAPFVSDIGLQGNNSGDDELFPSIAYVIQKRTLLGGPSNRGRLFAPGVWKGDFKFGLAGPNAHARWQQVFDIWGPAFIGSGVGDWHLTVRHHVDGTDELVTSLLLSPNPGHMRTRKIGVGV